MLGLVQARVAPEDPGPVRCVKDDPAAAGPDVISTTFRADQWVLLSPDDELLNVRGWFLRVTTTPDGETIDRSFGIWSGVDDLGEPIAYDTGVCRA